MNAPVVLAQLSGSSQPDSSPKTLKVEKPQDGQAITIHLDGNTRIDFSDVASEKLTFVRVGDKLIVLFDNKSTVTVEPVFDSSGHPLADVAFEMTPDHTLTGDQFTALFPITTDQSVLPAGGAGGPAAGANFSAPPPVDPLSVGNPLALLGAGFDQGNLAGHPSDVAPPPHVPTAEPDIVTVVEAGISPTNVPFAGTPVATGNVLTNDIAIDTGAVKVVTGVAAGAGSTPSGNVGATLTGLYGTLVMGADGSFTYTLNNTNPATNALAQGQHASDVFSYTMSNSLGQSSTTTLTIDVIGTDDQPVIDAGSKTETAPTIVETALTTGNATPDVQSGVIHFSDVDLTDRPSATVGAQTATYIAADGHTILTLSPTELAAIEQAFTVATAPGSTNNGAIDWTYSIADSALDFLARNETVTLVSTVLVDDHNGGTDTATVTVTLQGSDDKPVIDVGVTDAVTEQAGKTLSLSPDTVPVTVHFTDPDLDNVGHTATVTAVSASGVTTGILPGLLGTAELLSFFHINNVTKAAGSSDGDINATFSAPDLAFDYLAAGEKLTITYTLLLNDHAGGTDTQTVSVVVTGTNDAPTFVSGPETSHVKEDVNVSPGGNLHSLGALAFADVDLSDTHTASTSLVTASYSGGEPIPISQSVLQSALSTIVNDSTGAVVGSVGWSFALADSLVQFLGQGETLTLTYDVTVTDSQLASTTQTVKVTIQGTNDAPVITSGPESAPLAELPNTTGSSVQDTTSPVPTGTLNFTDVDLNDTHTVAVSVASAVWSGGPNIPVATEADLLAALSTTLHDSNGSGSGSVDWTFGIVDKDLDFLNQGETLTVTYDVVVKDSHSGVSNPQTVTVTITGAEDPGFLYFSGDGHSGQLNADLFRLDVNGDLTSIPVNPGHGSSAGEDGGFIQFANDLYFFANKDGVGDVLFKLDASGVATAVLDGNGHTVADPGGNVHFNIYDGSLYFGAEVSGHGDALVQIDPTGAVHVFDTIAVDPEFNGNFYPGEQGGFATFDGNLYFSALDANGETSERLFELTPAGGTPTEILYQGAPLVDAGIDGGFATFNGGLFFNAADPALFNFDVLFKLDANGNPTPVLDAFGGELFDFGGGPANFHVFDGSLYFTAISFEFTLDPAFTEDLFKVDANGGVSVLDYQGSQFDFTAANGHLGGLVDFDGKLFFSADTDITDSALIGRGFGANPVLFGIDGNGTATAVTNSSGQYLVDAGEDGGFVTFNGHQYFFADDPTHSAALFEMDASDNVTLVLDPTDPTHSLVAPQSTAPGQPGPDAHFTQFDGSLYFEAETSEGDELVQIDSSGVVHVIDVNPDAGPPTGDGFPGEDGGFAGYTPIATMFGTDGDDHLSGGANTVFIGGKGNDTISGAGPGANDTVVIDANFGDPSTHVSLNGGVVTVTTANGTYTDTLTGIDRIQFADKGLLIVDPTGQYGFSSVQAAVNAATAGDSIWVLPGTYTESTIPTGFSSTAGGLFIDTPNLTLQGVEADGTPITAVTDANKDNLPLIISGAQTDFGSNIFVGPDADNTVIQGLHLQAGAQTDNKLLEIWANNVTVENNFLDVNIGGTTYSGAIAVYFNDNGTPFTDEIASYTVANNILNEGIDISNGVGVPSPAPSPNQVISDNTFEGTFDISTGLGRYDTVVLNGQVPGIGWLLESTEIPTITGNQFGDNSTPFLLRGSDISAANLPTAGEVADFLAANGNPDTTYAYVEKPNGDLELAARDTGSGPFFSFAVANTIDTLELALEPAGGNNVFPDQRTYLQTGDTVIIQSGPNALGSAIDVDGLNVQADADSAQLTLTLATALPDGTPVTVQSLSLFDYAAGQGANVNVVGNDLGDTIVGNHGDNVITTGSGNDTITGGGGNDTINSGGGDDLIIYNVADGGRETVDGGSGTDTQIVSNLGGSAETFNINPIDASHLGINIEPGANNAVAATSGDYTISDTNVEEIGLHLGSAGDTVLVSGNLNGTGVLTSTITIDGGAGNDTVDASAIDPAYPVDIVFTGGGGTDSFTGGPGADTIIYNVADGGTETVAGGAGLDTQIIDNTGGTAETFNINPIDASHLGVNIEPGATVVPAIAANYEISDTGVEEIVIKLGAAGDNVVLSGDLSGTGVAISTITIQGGAGDDTVDLSQLVSNEDVVYDGAGQADSTGDTAVFGFAFVAASYTPIFDGSGDLIGVTISYTGADGPVTDTITNVETFRFSDGTKTIGDIFPATVHPDAVAVADTASQDAGTVVAQGNAITDVGDTPGIGAGVTLGITAVDGSAGNVGHDLTGTYGTLHLDADGGYTYTAIAALDGLTAGQTASDIFGVTVGSSNGGSVATTLTFNITGADDTPVEVADTVNVNEDATAAAVTRATGVLGNDTDRDTGEAATFMVSTVLAGVSGTALTVSSGTATIAHGTYGDLSINADGTYSYTPNNANAEALAAGQQATDVFSYTATEANGDSVSSTLTFDITGVNDAPVVDAHGGTLAYNGGQAATAIDPALTVTDVDSPMLHGATVAVTANLSSGDVLGFTNQNGISGSYNAGVLTLTGNASVAAYQTALDSVTFFDAGTTPSSGPRTISYQVDDGATQNHLSNVATATISIENAPVVTSGSQTVNVTEDETLSPNLVVNGGFETVDPGTDDISVGWSSVGFLFPPGSAAGPHSGNHDVAVATFNTPGTLSQTITDVAGVLYQLTFWAIPTDGGNTVTHDSNLTATWDNQTVVQVTNVASLSTPNPTSPSQYTEYTADVIGTGSDVLNLTFLNNYYWFLDDVSLTPVVTPGQDARTGVISFTDLDTTDTHTISFTPGASSGYFGTLTVTTANDSTGGQVGHVDWNFSVNNADIQSLAAGQVVAQTYTVSINDGHGGITTQNVVVDITGVNDAPVLTPAGPSLPSFAANAPTIPTETVASIIGSSISDADNGALQGIAVTGAANAAGSWQFSTDGGAHWTSFVSYTASSALLLGANDLVRFLLDGSNTPSSDTFTYHAWDRTSGTDGATADATINGGTTAFSVASDTVHLTLTGDNAPVITSAPETGSVVAYASFNVPLGQLVSDGGFENIALTPPWTVVDQAGDTATTTGGGHSGDDAGFLTGTTNSGDVVKLSQMLNTVAGIPYTITFWLQSSSPVPGGSFSSLRVLWDGTSELFLQNMATAGNWVEETLNVIGTGQDTIQFNMQDRVTYIFLDDVSVQANFIPGTEKTGGTINFTDADTGDTHGVSVAPNSNVGSFSATLGSESSNNSTGTVNWTFSATDAQISALVGPQQSTTETYTVTINDGHSGVASQVVTVDISNPDHTPQATSGAQTGSVTEGFSYSLNTTQLIADGGFEAGTNNGLGNSWAVTIHGSLGDVLEDQAYPVQAGTQSLLLWTGSDAANDVIKLTQSVANTVAGDPYTLTFFVSNDNSFDPSNFIHVIWNNQTVVSLSAIPESGFGDFTEYSATLVGTGTTSSLEFDFQNIYGYVLDSFSLQATATPGTEMAAGVITFTDQDADQHTVSVAPIAGASGYIGTLTASVGAESTSGTPGTVNWIYAVSDAAAASLAAGQSLTQTYVVSINDGHGGVTTQNVTITIHGATVTADTTPPTVTFTSDTLHSSPTADTFGGTIKDNATGTVTIQLFSGTSPTGTAVSGASTSAFVTAGAAAANWTISADTSLARHGQAYVQATDAHGNVAISASKTLPAGVSGEAINLALTDYSDHSGLIAATITGLAAGWALSEGTQNADGSWTVQTNDIGALSVTSPDGYVGALVLNVSESWTNADGTHGTAIAPDNVEAFAKGSPIFALSGDDTLTASTDGNDTLVFANQIGNDVVHSFDTVHDKIDLIGFNGFASFADVQAHLGHDAFGNAVLTLADGETITLNGVNTGSLNAGDFEFNQTPVTTNSGDMVIGDGALLPLSGIVDNTGSIHLGSAGSETDLEIVQHGVTLEGGGTVVLSDNAENVIFGSDPSVTLTNVDNVISGAGQIGEGQMTLVNEGSIIADGSNPLVIDTGANDVINSGMLEAIGAGGLTVHSDVANNGLLWANGGNITLDGDVSGMGSALISGNANLELGGAFNEQVKFDHGSTGTLTLDHSVDFKGLLSGFSDQDSIDLHDILGATVSLNYAENVAGTGGTLTVSDGTHTANIALSGQYATSDFLVANDSGNHALIQIEQHVHQMAAAA